MIKTKDCAFCEKRYTTKETSRKRIEASKYCSILCRNRALGVRNYKTGYWIDKDGYQIHDVQGKHFRVHRLVMEKKLGRKLLSSEIVHHIDRNRQNNHPNNLELLEDHSTHRYKHLLEKLQTETTVL